MLADSVGVALLVVLEPAERLAFVLHDMFAMPFDEIAPIVDRTPAATRQLASRARRRVRGRRPEQTARRNVDHRRIVDAFFAAARGGSLDDLLDVLDPDMVLHSHSGVTTTAVHGARNVAGRALHFAQPTADLTPVIVDGRAGVLVTSGDRRISLMAFTVEGDQITAIDALIDAARLQGLQISAR